VNPNRHAGDDGIQLVQLSNQKAFKNIISHQLTGTGMTYQMLINATPQ